MLKELESVSAQAVELATAAGAADVWASITGSRDTEYRVREGELEKAQQSTSRSLSLKLYVDGRYSNHTTTDLRGDRLKSFVEEAVALTRALEPDEARTITDPALFDGPEGGFPDIDAVDESIKSITNEQRLAICQDIYGSVKNDKVISVTSSLYDGMSQHVAVSSNGFSHTFESTYFWMGSSVTCQEEGDKRPRSGLWAGGRHQDSLPAPSTIGIGGLERTLSRMGAIQGPTRKGTMVVHPMAAANLIGQLLKSANARSVQQKRSIWAGNLGKKMVSSALTLVDDPLIPRGQNSRYHDGEGIASKALPLIQDGHFANIYVSTYYGKKLGMDPTTGGASNRVVQPGNRDMAAILKDVGTTILVTDWLGGNSDAATGDFSMGCRGHLVENGQIGASISEMNVTGNLLDLFNQLIEVGNDPWPYAAMLVPTLVFEGVGFSGA